MIQQAGLEGHRLFGLARLGHLDQEGSAVRGVQAEGLVDLALQPADHPAQAERPRDDTGHRLLDTWLRRRQRAAASSHEWLTSLFTILPGLPVVAPSRSGRWRPSVSACGQPDPLAVWTRSPRFRLVMSSRR